jgi:C4-dicarboxylate transporter, DctM subunit
MIVTILFLIFFGLLFFGVPVAVSLGLSSVFTMAISTFMGNDTAGITYLTQLMYTSFDSFPIMAVPVFILVGEIMNRGGAARRLIHLASIMVGKFKAGLAYVSIVASMFFACISGSGPADVAAIATSMIPQMDRRGYHRGYAAVCVGAAGTLGILIPPSIPAVIYGVVTSTSIGQLFLAGCIPGILTGIALMVVSKFIFGKTMGMAPLPRVSHNNAGLSYNESSKKELNSSKTFIGALYEAKYSILMPIIILGGIYTGIFTPTESAAVAVIYGLIVVFFLDREMKFKDLSYVLLRASMVSGIVLILIGTAILFGSIMTLEQFQTTLANWVLNISPNKHVTLFVIITFLIILGMFMETLAAIILFAPMLLKIVVPLGVDPIHFGIIMIMASEVGFMTPPVGEHLFIVSTVSEIPYERIIRYAIPYVITLIIAMIFITYVPQLSLFLPNMLYGY